MKIHLFQQCLIDMFYPHVGMAGVEVLERLGCDLVVPKKQVCCGQMFTNSGYNDAAMDAIKNTIECFENAEYVVSMSGSCAFAIRDEYHHFLKDQPEWLARAERLSGKIYEFTQFITDVLGVEDVGARFNESVTYHTSCHVTRLMGIKEPPFKLLKNVKDINLIELPRADRCCGFGGTFSVKNPEISEVMTREKALEIAGTGANVISGSDQACLMNIAGMLDRLHKEGEIDRRIKGIKRSADNLRGLSAVHPEKISDDGGIAGGAGVVCAAVEAVEGQRDCIRRVYGLYAGTEPGHRRADEAGKRSDRHSYPRKRGKSMGGNPGAGAFFHEQKDDTDACKACTGCRNSHRGRR